MANIQVACFCSTKAIDASLSIACLAFSVKPFCHEKDRQERHQRKQLTTMNID